MSNTSATGGYLIPATGPTKSAALLSFFQAVLVGVSGIAGSLVRPAYQLLQPTRPDKDDPTVNWIAFRIAKSSPDLNASGAVVDDDTGLTTVTKHGDLDLFVSCYGPDSIDTAEKIQAGLDIPQNREALQAAGVGVKECSDITHVPEDINERFYDRADMTITFKRAANWVYGVLSFLSSSFELTGDDAHDTPLEYSNVPTPSVFQYLVSVSPFKFNDVAYTEAFVLILKDADGNWTLTELKPPSGVHAPTMVAAITAATGSINVFLTHDLNPEDPDVYYTVLSNATWAEVDAQYPGLMELEASGLSAFTFNGSDYAFVMPDGWAVADDTDNDTWNRPPAITKVIS